MTTRFTLYPAIDSQSVRQVRACSLIRGSLMGKGLDHYVMRAGVAYKGRVDYFGDSFNGYKYDLKADEPWTILDNGAVTVPRLHSVVLDVTPNGLPPSLEGTTISTTIRHAYTNPAHRMSDPKSRAVLESVADHLNAIRAGDEVVSLALPMYVTRYGATGEYHEDTAAAQTPASGTFVNGSVSIQVYGTSFRPVSVMVTAHATGEALGNGATLGIAISDGTTDQNEHHGDGPATGDEFHVGSSYATTVNQLTTFTVRFRDVAATSQVLYQSITAITSEI